MRIGVIRTDHFFEPSEAQNRAMKMTIKALKKAKSKDGSPVSHELIEVDNSSEFLNGYSAYAAFIGIVGGEGNMYSLIDALEGEQLWPTYEEVRKALSIPNFLRPVLTWILSTNLIGEKRKAFLLKNGRNGGHSVRDLYCKYSHLQFKLREAWLEDVFRKLNLDCVLYPGLPLPAFRHREAKKLFPTCSYTFLMNVLGFPTGCLPVTTVNEGEEFYIPKSTSKPKSQDSENDSIARAADRSMRGSRGLPIGVQVMTGGDWSDELCLECMAEVERCLREAA